MISRRNLMGASIGLMFPLNALASTPRRSFLISEMGSGRILKSFNIKESVYPASITKLMTMDIVFTCLENGYMKETDVLTISSSAAKKPATHLGLPQGGQIDVLDACQAVTVHSCNDIATAFAEYIAGTEERFVGFMNKRAHDYNMQDTKFFNCTGLPGNYNNVSTAYDISLMCIHMMKRHPKYLYLFGLPYWNYNYKTYKNSNALMGRYPGMDFCKTGYIHDSGYNVACSVFDGKHRMLAVVTGCRSAHERDSVVSNLFNSVGKKI